MAAQNKVIICLGAPGSGRDEILLKAREISGFHYYHLFDYIVEEAKLEGIALNKLNILDFYDSQPSRMENLRQVSIEKITEEISEKPGNHIISTPFFFEWKGNSYKGLQRSEVQKLNPDLFVVIIDDLVRVNVRLNQDPQWGEHKFTLGEIARWRREEVSGVYELAEGFTPIKEIQIVSINNGPEFLREVMFNKSKEKVYLSHPITGEDKDFFANVTGFADSISNHYIVFDPYMMKDWSIVEEWRNMVNEAQKKGLEIPTRFSCNIEYAGDIESFVCDTAEVESAIKNIRFLIIDTDYKLIENSMSVVVYHPRESISAGVMCEMVYAKSLAKMVYVYYPYEPSPFFEWYSTKIFRDEKKLREFLIMESKLTGQTPLDIYSSPDSNSGE